MSAPLISGRYLSDQLVQVASLIAISLSVFQLWQGATADLPATSFRPIHLTWVLVLVFLVYPSIKHETSPRLYPIGRLIDLGLIAAVIFSGWTILTFDYDDMSFLFDGLNLQDRIAGGLLLLLLLEATRRTVGIVMAGIAIFFLTYAMFGDLLPSVVASKSFSLEEIIRFHIFSTNGVFGAPLAIAAGVVFIFVLFGAFLQVCGAGQFFIDCAFAIAGKYRGGPAKASVIASAALGSISGSAIANTVTTGALTIPMMKKLGYRPEEAAGIEASASTGGQIMPPVMGAGAFVMAQFTGIAYGDILLVSIAPAILYFACTLLYVHLMACKLNLKGMDRIEQFSTVMAKGWHFLIPLILITSLLVLSYSPVLVGIAGCAAVIFSAMCRKSTRITLSTFFSGMKQGALQALPISVACGSAGIVVGVVGQTGIGLQFTQFLMVLSSGYLWSVLALIAFAAVILGMGLPVTAAYIVLSIMAVPSLTELGVDLLTAHMIVFWLSQTSNVTPPIALAAFAGAAIAKASPMKSAIQAFKLSQGFFIIPAMMAFSGLIFYGEVSLTSYFYAIFITIILILGFAASIEGFFFHPLPVWQRLLLLSASLSILLSQDTLRLIGIIMVGIILIYDFFNKKKTQSK
ncbi:TRAP transporter fused permease subunit [uncultured Shewanella sp.]|uniref:TRAP transporter permease n=1 Tax=uncultured Shewanella sp. TaxID=173975 RepID=UPI00262E0120|nr:TRAP transporter fused permease subunit [uncultured Shewanella sp.]